MKNKRPVNLDLHTIKLPITGVASILHRISAVILWVAMAFFLSVLCVSLGSPEGFDNIEKLVTDNFLVQFIIWGFMTAAGYYTMAGLKHITQELGYFEELESGKLISKVAIGLGLVISFLFGVLIWA
ncbi:succinate dehydrogenase, cytochrome b556 subunit [Marinomonas sp. 2405UD66-6]|uniref:succinate dehydrogenase, cytochrome b556 subunit n=1 Tax=Marinomonas sp. 2405UD66-6 TaxID=3391834 RepID=UPI0039C8FA4F